MDASRRRRARGAVAQQLGSIHRTGPRRSSADGGEPGEDATPGEPGELVTPVLRPKAADFTPPPQEL